MKTKSLATILLLAIFAVSLLEGVWSYAGYDLDGFAESDKLDEGVDINELDEEVVDVNEAKNLVIGFDGIDESELFDASEESSNEKHKPKHLCKEKSQLYAEARCLKSKCKHLCETEGYKNGKCSKLEEDKVKKCYCVKHGKACKKEHHAPAPSSPVDAPAQAPASRTVAPTHAPSSPGEGPKSAPVPSRSPAFNNDVDAFIEEDPFSEPPSSPAPVDAPTNAPVEAPTNAPADAPVDAPTDAPAEEDPVVETFF